MTMVANGASPASLENGRAFTNRLPPQLPAMRLPLSRPPMRLPGWTCWSLRASPHAKAGACLWVEGDRQNFFRRARATSSSCCIRPPQVCAPTASHGVLGSDLVSRKNSQEQIAPLRQLRIATWSHRGEIGAPLLIANKCDYGRGYGARVQVQPVHDAANALRVRRGGG